MLSLAIVRDGIASVGVWCRKCPSALLQNAS